MGKKCRKKTHYYNNLWKTSFHSEEGKLYLLKNYFSFSMFFKIVSIIILIAFFAGVKPVAPSLRRRLPLKAVEPRELSPFFLKFFFCHRHFFFFWSVKKETDNLIEWGCFVYHHRAIRVLDAVPKSAYLRFCWNYVYLRILYFHGKSSWRVKIFPQRGQFYRGPL